MKIWKQDSCEFFSRNHIAMLKLLQVDTLKRLQHVPYCYSLKQTTLNGTVLGGLNAGGQGQISAGMQRSSWNGTLGLCSFTSSPWFICWFHRSHWSSHVTTADLSQSLSSLCIIISRIAVLQWDLSFSILLIGEPKSMVFISYVNSARPTKVRKRVNK